MYSLEDDVQNAAVQGGRGWLHFLAEKKLRSTYIGFSLRFCDHSCKRNDNCKRNHSENQFRIFCRSLLTGNFLNF